jgi:protein phosphatase-4 regulatory subunit 3
MIKEESDEEMFNIDISKKSIEFHNQRGIIITWKTGSENNEEDNTAISFQEKEGIIEIWNTILINQGKNPHDKNNALISDNQPETFLEVSLQNLPNLLRELSTDMDELKINNLISFLKTSKFEFIKKLGELLKEEEKKEEIKSLISTETNYTALPINSNRKKNNKLEKGADYNNHLTSIEKQIYKSTCMENIIYIYTIIKNLITLGNKDLIELLFNDECYLISFGALEYDLDVSEIVPHRKYFKEIVKFKNPLNIEDEEIRIIFYSLDEVALTIQSTYFFLSKIGSRVRKVIFPKNLDEVWSECDVVITARNEFFEKNKPEGKKIVLINREFNNTHKDEADFNYNSLSDIIKDNNFFKNIKG